MIVAALAPAADEAGTNLLLRRPPVAIPSSFGKDSYRRHLEEAAQRDVPVAVIEHVELAFDLDLPDDILTLTLYPHAMQQANAFYSRDAQGIMFGYAWEASRAIAWFMIPWSNVGTVQMNAGFTSMISFSRSRVFGPALENAFGRLRFTGLYLVDAALTWDWGTFGLALQHLALPAATLAFPAAKRVGGLGRSGVAGGVFLGLLLAAGYALQTAGLERTTVSSTGFITGMYVVLTPLIALVLYRSRIGAPSLLLLVVAVLLALTAMIAVSPLAHALHVVTAGLPRGPGQSRADLLAANAAARNGIPRPAE